MQINNCGEQIFDATDLCDLLMQGRRLGELTGLTVDHTVNLVQLAQVLEDPTVLASWKLATECADVASYDLAQQSHWHMPEQYQHMDIAQHVLSLCKTDAELQRCGQELLLYQERELFNLLRYLTYLVDVMKENHIIWGVGRGSSVASYVLYLLGVHRINSMFYDLDIHEFLR
jgi:hypothetical protein